MYYICMTVLIFLAVLGLCAVCRAFACLLSRTDVRGIVVLEPVSGHCADVEFVLRNAVRRVKLYGTPGTVFCVDDGMDADTRRVCELVSRDYPFVRLCTRSEIVDIVKNL